VSVRYGSSPTAQPAAPSPNTPAASGTVHTEGAQSSGIISGGKVGIEYQGGPPVAPPTK
jgi:hypothetical protein